MAKVLKVIVNVILLCSIVTAIALLVPPVMGVTTVIVDSPEKNTNLSLGTVTYANEKPIGEIKVGDTILDETTEGSFVYDVKEIEKQTNSFKLQDKYDKNAEPVVEVLRNSVTKVVITVPVIGYAVMAMQSMEGIIIISLIIVFVIILFVLSELWKKSDEEDDLEEGDFEEDEFLAEELKEEGLTKRERKALEKEQRKKEKSLRKAQKKAEKYGGAVEDYMDEDIPLLPKTQDITPEHVEHSDVDVILAETAGELAKGIGAVTGEIPVIDESVIENYNKEMSMENHLDNEEESKEVEKKEMKILIPRPTAEELLQKALAEGDQPKIVEDKESGVTLLDYSDIL